jgi:octaprenyl-diphosphate synthase
LNVILNYIIDRKGKQMRPMLVFLTAKLSGGITPSTYTAASLIEILHTASLIHDDVVDESYERRNHFSINALWKSKMAVLVGDYLLAEGLLLSLKKQEYDILRIVSDAVREMSEGELLQMRESRKLSISENIYFEIIKKKTAALIKSCAACGARSALASTETIEKMALFGEYLGIAFQIQDDLLDFQVLSTSGKPSGNDLKEKKITLPLIYALQHANIRERRNILSIVNKRKSNTKLLAEIVSFINEKGGIQYSSQKMFEFRDKAIEMLNDFPDNQTKISLREFAYYTTSRNQ